MSSLHAVTKLDSERLVDAQQLTQEQVAAFDSELHHARSRLDASTASSANHSHSLSDAGLRAFGNAKDGVDHGHPFIRVANNENTPATQKPPILTDKDGKRITFPPAGTCGNE